MDRIDKLIEQMSELIDIPSGQGIREGVYNLIKDFEKEVKANSSQS